MPNSKPQQRMFRMSFSRLFRMTMRLPQPACQRFNASVISRLPEPAAGRPFVTLPTSPGHSIFLRILHQRSAEFYVLCEPVHEIWTSSLFVCVATLLYQIGSLISSFLLPFPRCNVVLQQKMERLIFPIDIRPILRYNNIRSREHRGMV